LLKEQTEGYYCRKKRAPLIERFGEVKSLSLNEEIPSDRRDVKFPGLISTERENDAQNGSSKLRNGDKMQF